jgi:hypothetical protein
MSADLLAPLSIGELIDKITILEIKAAKIADADKLQNVRKELDLLTGLQASAQLTGGDMPRLKAQLLEVNQDLWQIEDHIRDHETRKDFGPSFIALARSVYFKNDRRAEIKKEINLKFNSPLVEEKSYKKY